MAEYDGWRSLHVFCHATAEQDALALGLRAALGGDGEWFFVRYWLGGPHLRVRVRTSRQEALVREVVSRQGSTPTSTPLTAAEFYERIPVSLREGHDDDAALPWYPPGTVLAQPYEPEFDRYGGREGMTRAESTFVASSRLALAVIARRSGFAARVTLAAWIMRTCIADLALADQFGRYGTFWSRSVTLPPVQALDRVVSASALFAPPGDILDRTNDFIASLRGIPGHDIVGRSLIVASQLHMTNNRLAIPIAWEAGLGQRLWRCDE